MTDKHPQVFISYSWSSEDYKKEIKEIAERLMRDGVLVKLDVWDLRDGQDKYAYMEQCVTSEDIDKVLIFSDKAYTEKANNRKGGVGDETIIISPNVYNNAFQEKFIPIVMEKDDTGEPYLPAYLAGRMYRDFTLDEYELEYERLVRTIYEMPSERKPEVGGRPKWLDEDESVGIGKIKGSIRHANGLDANNFKGTDIGEFVDQYIELIKVFYREEYKDPSVYLSDFRDTLKYRNVFLDYIRTISKMDNFGRNMADIFERIYNRLFNLSEIKENCYSCNYDEFDIFRLHIWELFICVTAYMLNNELYGDLHEMLVHTYFLRTSPLGNQVKPASYEQLRFHSKMMEEWIKPTMEGDLSRKYTLTGHYIVSEREYRPIYTKTSIANADLFLYQVYNGLNLEELTMYCPWFPTCYIYAEDTGLIWKKMK